MRFLLTMVFITGSVTGFNRLGAQEAWHEKLPPCPCTNPDQDGVKLNDGWAKDKGNIAKYHKGASSSYRSYPFVNTTAGKSGQQCCYDSSGHLITAGRGAGTPDKISSCRGENKKGDMKIRWGGIMGHIRKDVRPWKRLMKKDPEGWQAYNAQWPPNNGSDCNENITL